MERVDVALVGGGIMSATLGSLIAELMPGRSMAAFERAGHIAVESSHMMNNAGTGHAGNCELNYTPMDDEGVVDIDKAVGVNRSFDISLELWAHLVESGDFGDVGEFVNPVPHMSFVMGESDVAFLERRQQAMSAHPMFAGMGFSRDEAELAEWLPLVMEGRDDGVPVAATRVARGTDVNFGRLTSKLFDGLSERAPFDMHLSQQVDDLRRDPEGGWRLVIRDLRSGKKREIHAGFVFLGAGGGALPLLQRSGIPEGRGYGGFPVSGRFLVCSKPEVIERHQAKVYGKADLGAPPMSVPHLDTRVLDGRRSLLFGPFAGFTTRYMRSGSSWDLFGSLKGDNLGPMLAVARDNWGLTRYLMGQAMQSQKARLDYLRRYYPTLRDEDWSLAVAGYRVQIIKRDSERRGKLEFGTEVVSAADGSLAALLGASPGASTAARTMLDLLHRCFPTEAADEGFQRRLHDIAPSYGTDLAKDPAVLQANRARVNEILGLHA